MKKLLFIASLLIMIFSSSCGVLREKILEAPDEVTIPEGALTAICIKDNITYKHVYQADGIYEYYIDGVRQTETILDTVQEQAYFNGESMANYLRDEFGENGCDIQDYVAPDAE